MRFLSGKLKLRALVLVVLFVSLYLFSYINVFAQCPQDGRFIFNGQDLTGWDGDDRFWRVEDGVLIGEHTRENRSEANTFLIWEEESVSDFEICFEFRFVLNDRFQYGNSGLQLRSERFVHEDTPELAHRVRGFQADFAIGGIWTGTFYEERGRDVLAERGTIVTMNADGESDVLRFAEDEWIQSHFSHTDWNEYRVSAIGNRFRSWINGQLMNQFIDESPEFVEEGILAFQLHAGAPMRIELRNIRFKSYK